MTTRVVVAAVLAAAALTCVVVSRQSGPGAAHRAIDAAAQSSHAPAGTHRVVRSTPPQLATTAPVRRVAELPEHRSVPTARPPHHNPCAHNGEHKQVLVSLADQRTWLCAGRRVHAAFAVTTGRTAGNDATPTGNYAVQALTQDTVLNPDTGGAYHVKYWIPFKWGMFGFHDAPWQKIAFGSASYRTQGSLGCVHMRTHDIARLFRWVQLGTPVTVVARSLR